MYYSIFLALFNSSLLYITSHNFNGTRVSKQGILIMYLCKMQQVVLQPLCAQCASDCQRHLVVGDRRSLDWGRARSRCVSGDEAHSWDSYHLWTGCPPLQYCYWHYPLKQNRKVGTKSTHATSILVKLSLIPFKPICMQFFRNNSQEKLNLDSGDTNGWKYQISLYNEILTLGSHKKQNRYFPHVNESKKK